MQKKSYVNKELEKQKLRKDLVTFTDQLSKKLNETNERTIYFLNIASSGFSANELKHKKFIEEIYHTWTQMGISIKVEHYSKNRTKKSSIRKRKNLNVGITGMIDLFIFKEDLTWDIINIQLIQFQISLCQLLIYSGWMKTVENNDDVPSTLWRALRTIRVNLEIFFPSAIFKESTLPYYVDNIVCTQRLFNYKEAQEEEVEMNISDDEDEVEVNTSSSGSIRQLVENTSKDRVILSNDEQVTVQFQMDIAKPLKTNLHPYSLSAILFTVADYLNMLLAENMKQEPLIDTFLTLKKYLEGEYCFEDAPKDYQKIVTYLIEMMNDYVIVTSPNDTLEQKIKALNAKKNSKHLEDDTDLEGYILNVGTKREMKQIFDFFSDFQKMMSIHKYTGDKLFRQSGQLYNIKFKRRHDNRVMEIKFDRNIVTPIDLHTTMKIMKLKFNFRDEYAIDFDEKDTTLFIGENFFADIQHLYIPQLCTYNSHFFKRTIYPAPLYPIHVKNFLRGYRNYEKNAKSLLYAMKGLLRSFDGGYGIEKWPDAKDEITSVYTLLPHIINKYKTSDMILRALTEPFKNNWSIWFTKDEPIGTPDTMNIYAGLKAFCLINYPHITLNHTIRRLAKYLLDPNTNEDIRIDHSKLTDLVSRLYDKYEREPDEFTLDIPDNYLDEDEFSFPNHVLFYLFCADERTPAELSVLVFESIYINVRNTHRIKMAKPRGDLQHLKEIRDLMADAMRKLISFKDADFQEPDEFEGLIYLYKALEELREYSIQNKKEVKKIEDKASLLRKHLRDLEFFDYPIQFDDETMKPMLLNNSFPIWKAPFRTESQKRDKHLSQFLRGQKELPPLIGCHRDLIETVVLYPCSVVQVPLTYKRRLETKMDETTSKKQKVD